MFKIGDKLTGANYSAGAVWATNNKATINPKTWEIEELPENEKAAEVRAVRNQYLKQYVDDRAKSPFMWEEVPEEEKELVGAYRKYLMDYPKTDGWYEQPPNTFDEWKEDLNATEQIKTMGDVYGTVQSN